MAVFRDLHDIPKKSTIKTQNQRFFLPFFLSVLGDIHQNLTRQHTVENFPERDSKSSAYSVSLTTLKPFVEIHRSLENLQKATNIFRDERLGAQKLVFPRLEDKVI